MKYLERLLQQGWLIQITQSDERWYYIDATRDMQRRMGFSKENFNKKQYLRV
jgi:uncharacterized protein YchJ